MKQLSKVNLLRIKKWLQCEKNWPCPYDIYRPLNRVVSPKKCQELCWSVFQKAGKKESCPCYCYSSKYIIRRAKEVIKKQLGGNNGRRKA